MLHRSSCFVTGVSGGLASFLLRSSCVSCIGLKKSLSIHLLDRFRVVYTYFNGLFYVSTIGFEGGTIYSFSPFPNT